MNRVVEFLPSMLVVGAIGSTTMLYLWYFARRYADGLSNVAWLEENMLALILAVGYPSRLLVGPTLEELLFRAPLIIMFSALTGRAWYGILISGLLFSLIHFPGNKVHLIDLRQLADTDVRKAVTKLKQDNKGYLGRKLLHVVLTFPLGVLCGYFGIKYQSLWVSVGVHFAWNLIMPEVIPILILVISVIYAFCKSKLLRTNRTW